MIKMIAFDFDGTIADTIPLCIKAFDLSVAPYVGHHLTKKEIVNTFGLDEKGMIRKVVKKDWKLALRKFYSHYERLHGLCQKPFAGIFELIQYLKAKGIMVVLITGKGKRSCDISLANIGMENCFDIIMYGNAKKTNKENEILIIMGKYSLQTNEFYYIGDAFSDVISCRKAGVCCLSALWANANAANAIKKINADYMFFMVSELRKFLQESLRKNDDCNQKQILEEETFLYKK